MGGLLEHETDNSGDVLGLERLLHAEHVARMDLEVVLELGADEFRLDAGDPNPGSGNLHPQGLGHRLDTVLGGGVDARRRPHLGAEDGRGRDQVTTFCGSEVVERRVCHPRGSFEVDADIGAQPIYVRILDGGGVHNAGVVEDDVEPTEAIGCRVDELLRHRRVGDVRGEGYRLEPEN